MNTILQKRIEEAAKKYADKIEEQNPNSEAYNIDGNFIAGATFSITNQWISVDEALPPKEDKDSSITVLVHCRKGWCGIDYYRYKYGEWLNNGNAVTHWMPIPELMKGRE